MDPYKALCKGNCRKKPINAEFVTWKTVLGESFSVAGSAGLTAHAVRPALSASPSRCLRALFHEVNNHVASESFGRSKEGPPTVEFSELFNETL